jgi:curved DNA-binding protein CbpA
MDYNMIAQKEIMNMVSRNLEHIENANVPPVRYNDRIQQQSTIQKMGINESEHQLHNLQRLRNDPLKESILEKRSHQYRQTIDKIDQNNNNAFRLFELQPGFSLSQLKRKYIRLTKVCHPDIPGGSDERFTLVTKYYMYLLDYYHRTKLQRKYGNPNINGQNEQEQTGGVNYESYLKSREHQSQTIANNTNLNLGSGKKFDVNTFNKIFTKNKFYDPTHDGYGDWLKKANEEDAKKAPKMFGKKFNMNIFNSAFEEQRRKQNTAIIPIDEVKSFNESEIGAGGVSLIDDGNTFSSQFGNLQATDLKEVYSNGLLGVNPELARREYRNAKEYQRERDSRMTPLTFEEKQREENRKAMFLQQEKTRLQKLAERDAAISDHYMRIQGLLQ